MRIEVVQCGMCKHYDSEQYCEVWEQYITNDAFYCACGAKADHKTEPQTDLAQALAEGKESILSLATKGKMAKRTERSK